MRVTNKDAAYIADLAKLKFSEEELNKMTNELDEILTYIDKLNELDTEQIEPLSHPIELQNVFRADVLLPSTPRELALKNAPEKTDSYFKSPKVLNQ